MDNLRLDNLWIVALEKTAVVPFCLSQLADMGEDFTGQITEILGVTHACAN